MPPSPGATATRSPGWTARNARRWPCSPRRIPGGQSGGSPAGQALMIWAWDGPNLTAFDPGYFQDFWLVPGYAGADGILGDSLVEEKTTVRQVLDNRTLAAMTGPTLGAGAMAAFFRAEDGPVAVTLSDGDVARLVGATIRFTSGAAAGRKLYCTGAFNGGLLSSVISGPVFEDVEAGDEVVIDNRDWLAYCYYHRYQAPPGNPAARQFIVDGRPIYPQRPLFPMTEMRSTTRAGDHTGRFTGKMIIVQNAMDDYAWPHGAVVYATPVREALGDRTDGQLRVWFNDNASHVPGSFLGPATASRLIDYGGSVDQVCVTSSPGWNRAWSLRPPPAITGTSSRPGWICRDRPPGAGGSSRS